MHNYPQKPLKLELNVDHLNLFTIFIDNTIFWFNRKYKKITIHFLDSI